ncbi:hypothetical protein KUV80_00240 [Fictibacillus nanhaiensis]|uniref:hypothetical protein n=1 Tax=Fictibacillus nanhaiensis TaxID=742169 RepID=UPI001C985A73|nr:hypothetical protein [Fictibacillus nanhaiensis]MBY6035060.1 hypothetical protein [Fictibacillus nanhaiensis]
MINKKKLTFFSFLFLIVFTIIGDAYIYYIDGKVFESDFKYQTDVKNKKLKQEYVRDLEKYSKDFDLKIYVISSDVTSKNSATYTVYASPNNKDFFKNRILTKKDNSKFSSLVSGKRKIVFKPLQEIIDINEKSYYVFGTNANVEKLRSVTNDKYGMSKPFDNGYSNDAPFMIAAAWIFIFLIILIFTFFEVSNYKKEALIRYLNGTDKKNVVMPLIVINSITILWAAIIGLIVGMTITESYKFINISVLTILLIILCSNSLYLLLFKLDVKKTFVRSYYTAGYKLFAFFVLLIISIMSILILTFNFKTMHDSILTINQKDSWEKFYNYDNVLFFFKEHTKETNMDTDEEYAVKFYNENLNRFHIYLSFDFSNNGGIASSMVNTEESIVYLNKHAKKDLDELGVKVDNLKKDTFYIISRYSKDELKKNGIYDETSSDEVDFLLNKDNEMFETITIQESYTLLVHDINMANLADNYKKNPIIILDTHSVLPSEKLSGYVFNSLVKFNKESDFNNFIESIGYQNEVFYKNNIKNLYKEKQAEKILVLIINIILSVTIMILFNISLSAILKMDFNSRAVEIAIDKIFGKTLLRRYKGLFRLLISAFIIGVSTALAGKLLFYNFSLLYVAIASLIVFINICVILLLFINRYEKISIPRVLKGGI